MSKHTPGPWHVVLSDNATPHILHEHGCDSTDCSDLSSRGCVMPAEIVADYNTRANAHLIAAAPELLDSAQLALSIAESWIRDQLDGTSYLEGAMQSLDPVRAAIAKALGEE